MSTPVYVLPDSHENNKYRLADKVAALVHKWEQAKKDGTEALVEGRVFGYTVHINGGWDRYPVILRELSNEFGVKSYNIKAEVIKASEPEVLFLEEYSKYRPLFRLLPRLDTDIIESLTGETDPLREFSSHRPIYDVCKEAGIGIIPIDDKDLMDEYTQVSYLIDSIIKHGGEKRKKDIPALKKKADRITLRRSKKMLELIWEELGADPGRTFVAMVGTMHYENFKKIESGVTICHINERLGYVGSNLRI